jgi:hypothetical protein
MSSNSYQSPTPSDSPPRRVLPLPETPLLRNARREAAIVLAIWATALIYSVGFCAIYGYGPAAQRQLTLVFGFPFWVFWGVVVPWLVCAALSMVLCNFVMTNEDLGEDPDEAEGDDVF